MQIINTSFYDGGALAEHMHQQITERKNHHTDEDACTYTQCQSSARTAVYPYHTGGADILADIGGDSSRHTLNGKKHKCIDFIGAIKTSGKGRAITVDQCLHGHNPNGK